MRQLTKNKLAQAGMVGAAIGILITIIIGALIYFSIGGSVTPTTRGTTNSYADTVKNLSINASDAANNQAGTFFTIAPIIAVVIVAVVVIGYVNRIGG